MGSSKSNTGLASILRKAIPITSLTWTSRQARTQSPQSMQASRLTAMAGCDRSGFRMPWAGKREASSP